MNIAFEPPMTWVDVARTLANVEADSSPLPGEVLRARIGWSGVLFEVDGDLDSDALVAALESLFPLRVKLEPLRIELDGSEGQGDLLVEVERVAEGGAHRPPFGVIDGIIDFRKVTPLRERRSVPIAAALSVKGGTGRTTTAVAFSLQWAALVGGPILLVDADLEAPGISYLFETFAGRPKVSLEDLVALAHAEDDADAPSAVKFVSERLRDHLLPGNVYVLPLRRTVSELASSAIRPEHLATPERPFALAELLCAVAEEVGAAGVVVDVRAGLVPIGVNLAMDPDVSPIIVTNLAEQSIRATSGLVSFLGREFRRSGGAQRRPLLVVNRVPLLFKQTGMDRSLVGPLSRCLVEALVGDVQEDVASTSDLYSQVPEIQPFIEVDVPELPDMQVTMGGWREFVEQLRNSGFARSLEAGASGYIATELTFANDSKSPLPISAEKTVEERRSALAAYADRLIAAENVQGEVPRPLVTQPLSALASRYKSEVPIAIAEGAKGTGKTLAARFVVSKSNWSEVVSDLGGVKGSVSALMVPVVSSIQSSGSLQQEVDKSRQRIAAQLGYGDAASVYQTTSFIKESLSKSLSESDWTAVWLDCIAWSVGFKSRVPGAGEELFEVLRARAVSLVAVFEGLEELYASVADAGVDVAMRSLLVTVPQRLRSESRRPIGLLTFIRRDTVEAAISQNLDQFRREYAAFALTWTESDVLELAAWLATQSGAMPNLWDSSFHEKSSAERAAALQPFWGTKLGPDDRPGRRTREAYTATWVVAVLSDLRGRLVPRDLVRLLASAAGVQPDSEELKLYEQRLLVPRALRAAVDVTSSAKVNETVEEIGELRAPFDKFKSQADELSVPLTDDVIKVLNLTDSEVSALIRHGIIFGDKSPYEVPELFRRGLGLKHSGARRSVVDLYNRARKSG